MNPSDEKSRIAKAAGLMSVATLISRILGYVRDMIFALYFGATGISDTFFAAFRIPNLLRELFAEGSMSAAFIPVLTEYRKKYGEEEATGLVKTTFTFILVVVGLVCLVGIICSPAIVSVIAPGFLAFPEKFSLTVLLTRIMFPFLLFISLAALVMGALNTKRVFFIPALAPAMLNVTLIVSIVLFESNSEHPITAAAIGVLAGGFVQFAFQLPSFFKNGFHLGIKMNFNHPGLKRMSILLIPATLALAVNQINIVVSNILASYLQPGSITYLFYSMRLVQFPIGIFGVAMGTAILPTLSEHAVKGDYEKLAEDFSFALRLLFFITIPAMAGLIALREPLVNVLFQRGRFDYSATAGTAEALLFYSLGIWSVVGVRVITAGFYSLQDTRTPVKIAVVAMISNIVFSILLMNPLKHSGLAFANSLASGINFILLIFFFRKRLKRIGGRVILSSFIKTASASAVMGLAGMLMLRGELWKMDGHILTKTLYMAAAIICCAFVYGLLSYILKSEELSFILRMMRMKMRKKSAEVS
ncbi:MAG TPA: murein biosynthesis integral membrane protein MurJ [Thermodesulfovibrionales bacterium]|nr:murein biosynthesis integral membrane protein MurJ [Thermodesulfovibrionales bacterium]